MEFVCLYQALKEEFSDHGNYFAMTKKFHDLYHLAQRACDVNPTMGSCMQQEDLMGKVKSLVLKCVQGAKPLASITKTMTKYRLGLQLEHGRAR